LRARARRVTPRVLRLIKSECFRSKSLGVFGEF
jgi:hypothetical protein